METVVVKESPIHGKGVFALRRIELGEVIIEGCREVLSDEAVKALPVPAMCETLNSPLTPKRLPTHSDAV
jgi:SET domain-containing protein